MITLICALALISVAFAQTSDDTKSHGLDKVEVKVGKGAWQMATGTAKWNASGTLSPGINTIYARAISAQDTDISGKIYSKPQKTNN